MSKRKIDVKLEPFTGSLSSRPLLETSCGSTVTSKRARYQCLLRCLQSTASCCLSLITLFVSRAGDVTNIDVARAKLISLTSDQEEYNYFYRNLFKSFPKTNLAQVIELAVTTNIVLCSLENEVSPPHPDGTMVAEPIFELYRFLLRICHEKPILVMGPDDARGTFCSYIQESMEHFIADQTRFPHKAFEPLK